MGENYGPIYHNTLEDRYLYIIVEEDEGRIIWFLSDNSLLESNSLRQDSCIMKLDDVNRFDVRQCHDWRTDNDPNQWFEDWEEEPF